jgi:hypothetical protein
MAQSMQVGQLDTIQKENNLNDVYAIGEVGKGNAYHHYTIVKHNSRLFDDVIADVNFQDGARNAENSVDGVLDCDLLEIVRDRLKGFQSGAFATEYNEHALKAVEEALTWMNKRVKDRAARGVLGTEKQ